MNILKNGNIENVNVNVYAYIKNLCDLLDIQAPKMSFDTSHFPTDTTMALCDWSGDTIYLKQCKDPDPDYLFAVAHEIRHVWQIKSNRDHYFASYKSVDQCSDPDSYNLQEAEIDANAFAGVVMIEYFGMRPLFSGLSNMVKNKIGKRMFEIGVSLSAE
jgi:Zn-dependent peptidase ImmA (M78 family)